MVEMINNNNGKQVPGWNTRATKMRIGLIIVSTFLVHCGGTWAYAFFIMIKQGKVSFYEPIRPLLMVEFGLAAALTLIGFSFLGMAIWKR